MLIGNGSANILDGGAGSDVLIGLGGADTLIGGGGADIFAFNALTDSKTGVAARDVIADFSHAEGDRIDLSAIDADSISAEDQAFFLGGSSFTKHAGEIIQVQQGGGIVLRADVNGDGVADFALLLQNVAGPLVSADFIL
jgi:Ca2+-binding RTX toxin-like protein